MAGSPKSAPNKDSDKKDTDPKKKGGDKSEEDDNIIRISKQHNVPFYVRAGTNFLQGVTGKDGVEKKVFDSVVISALGAAIPTAATVVAILEKNGVATIEKIATGYTELEYGKRAHIMITVKRNPSYVAPVKGGGKEPECPERLKSDKLEKKMKKVLKEGGKRGVEIEGAADMGGLKYFCTKAEEPAGDLDMLVECMKAMNQKSDPTEEERKGGSGHIGKLIMSMAEDNNLCVCAYVPPSEQNLLSAKDWLNETMGLCGVPNDMNVPREDSNALYAQMQIQNNGEKGVFCLKLRDYVIQHANGVLRKKGLIPEVVDDDEDDVVYGDDDFDL
jgi:hypothetical protein